MPNGHHSETAMLQAEDQARETAVLRAEIERLRGEIRIGADRLELAAGICKEWADRLHALEQKGDKP